MKWFARLSVILGVILMGLSWQHQPQSVQAATVSPLITAYQPQLKTATYSTSYTDASGQTQQVDLTHPGITLSASQLTTMQKQVRAGVEPWASAFTAYANDSFARKVNPRIYFEANNDIFIHIPGLGPLPVTAIPVNMWGIGSTRTVPPFLNKPLCGISLGMRLIGPTP
ncbi:hypothetical protein JCM14202_495 [Agrilactobacillus composti DSM 18527 = JCM 14202]|uniref:hypothetical protein n=1 Tax=Agrilactobacillus composti TaxID=398555 RepID=UPI00042DEB61|nr:hypothetical protein [Agrilactobacillus composti]GAF38673.1 hypothetical protein JCM14202_495 [Agrilactobacillus composti DSM 18527 = JCM 14202]